MKSPKLVAQNRFAKQFGLKFHEHGKLVAGGSHGSGAMPPIERGGTFWTDLRVNEIAWWAVAKQLTSLFGCSRIIDHAWFMAYEGRPDEAWAFVTEPYVSMSEAGSLAILAADAMAGWDLDFRVFPQSESTWNPGGCVPFVVTFRSGAAGVFIRNALIWALQEGWLR